MPNTIADLNIFSSETVPYEDQRPFSITFSANSASNQSVAVDEDVIHDAPVGIDITSMSSLPANTAITYTLDFSGTDYANLVLTWPTLPSSMAYANGGPGVYAVEGPIDPAIWNLLKSPQVVIKDRTANYSYTGNIQYPTPPVGNTISSWQYTVDVTVGNTHSELSTPSTVTWDEDVPFLVTGNPSITDTYVGPGSYTLTVAPNTTNAVLSMSTAGPATSGFDLPTRTLTITGTKDDVNATANSVTITPGGDYDQTYTLVWTLTNPVSNLVSAVNQSANIGNTNADLLWTKSYNYTEDQPTTLVFTVDDNDASAINYTLAFTQTSGNNGVFLLNGVSQGVGNAMLFANAAKATINAANVTFVPEPDSTGTVTIEATISKWNPSGNVVLNGNGTSATLTNTGTHTDFTLTTAYDFAEDQATTLSYNITDLDLYANTYTLTMTETSGNIGLFLVDGVSQGVGNALVLTGSKSTVNSANVTYVPQPDSTANVTLAVTLDKNNTLFGPIANLATGTVTLTCTSTHTNFDTPSTYIENTLTDKWEITDQDPNATTYTINLVPPSYGYWYIDGVNLQYEPNSVPVGNAVNGTLPLGGVVWNYTGNIPTINAANIRFRTFDQETGNIPDIIAYPDGEGGISNLGITITKENTLFGNVTMVGNLKPSLTNASTVPHAANIGDRDYTGRQDNLLLGNVSIQDGTDYGQSYNIKLDSDQGWFGTSQANAFLQNTLELIGNITELNAALPNVVFVPNSTAGTGTWRYRQSRGPSPDIPLVPPQSQLDVTSNLVLTGNATFSEINQVYTSNTTVELTFQQVYYGNVTVALIGGGGGGGTDYSSASYTSSGGGGGGGEVIIVTPRPSAGNALTAGTYTVTRGHYGSGGVKVGVTPANGTPGYDSVFTNGTSTLTARGGGAGTYTGEGGTFGNVGGLPAVARCAANTYQGVGGGGAEGPAIIFSQTCANGEVKSWASGSSLANISITGNVIQVGASGYGGGFSSGGFSDASSGRGGAVGLISIPDAANIIGGGGGGQGSGTLLSGQPYRGGNGTEGAVILVVKNS